jgi:octaprenyl-diphosphate synthase
VTLRMIEGELYQLTKNGDADITEDEHFDIIRRKTAYLFGGCAQIGGMLGKVPSEHEQALQEYGFNLGMAFQLVDDLLDFTASEAELGKPVLSDLKEGKLTLPLILLLPRVGPGERRMVQQVLEDRAFERVTPGQVLDVVAREGTVEEVEEMAHDFAEEARVALEPFAPGDARDALELAPDFVLNRRH